MSDGMVDELVLTKMTVEDVLERWPQTAEVFNRYSPTCIGCAVAPFCTISDAARIYGLSLENFTADLKKVIEGQK